MLTLLRHLAAGLVLAAITLLTPTGTLAQAEYRIGPGDVLTIEVLEDSSLNRSVTVLPDGRFSFPFAGSLTAQGRSVRQIESAITSAIAPNFATDPNVFVSVQPRERAPVAPPPPETIDVYFMGEVNAPGLKPVAPGTTLLQALAQSGGLTRFAATKRIQLRREGQAGVISINYKALSQGQSLERNLVLRDGDVILVPERRLFE